MNKSIMDVVAAAKSMVPEIGPDEAAAMMERDDVLLVDVRDLPEVVESGKIKGALQVSRGMLEFRADETSCIASCCQMDARGSRLRCRLVPRGIERKGH